MFYFETTMYSFRGQLLHWLYDMLIFSGQVSHMSSCLDLNWNNKDYRQVDYAHLSCCVCVHFPHPAFLPFLNHFHEEKAKHSWQLYPTVSCDFSVVIGAQAGRGVRWSLSETESFWLGFKGVCSSACFPGIVFVPWSSCYVRTASRTAKQGRP